MTKIKIRDIRQKGFFIIENEVVDVMLREIGANALAVYSIICRHADKNQESFPSQEVMLEKLGLADRKSTQRAINILEEHKMIIVEQTKEEGTGKFLHNTYTICDKSEWEPVGTKPTHGIHGDKTYPRFEADTVGTKPPTIYTHNINNTHIEKIEKDQVQESEVSSDIESNLPSRKKASRTKKAFGYYPQFDNHKNSNYQSKPKRGGIDARDVL